MIEDTDRNLHKGQIQTALFAALAIAEEMTELLNYNVDDSNGEIGGSIEGAFEILGTLTDSFIL